ncbi:uncharacterized protein LOC132790121 isoform X1 [Drosophila nasuta]|uniref:uncharacterized protein LOC132790121 isoform X1 n=1 Tax=Drosophila nasuta TaxID=42062 RepID=UPI00295ECE01|nr:uncharacterized protein LOC132790121 isoform X1 [Drosophila nasuta]
METINDDCWLEIINYLNLEDQLALYKATNGFSNRVSSNVIYSWKHQLNFTLDEHAYEKFEEMPEMLDVFLSNINDTMQGLEFQWVTLKFLYRWKNYTFPNMKTLEYTVDDCDIDCDSEVIAIMTELFPGLHSLKSDGTFYCGALPKWTQLRKLDLSEWSPDYNTYRSDSPEEIAKCMLMEELLLPDGIWDFNLHHDLMTMPKLHTLAIELKIDFILAEMLEKRGKDVHTIVFNDCIWEFSIPTLQKLRNLRQLTLLDNDGFTSEELRDLIVDLKQLEQIDLVDFQIWSSETELWQTVACCPSLKILNLSGMQLYENFFEFGRRVMEKTLNNRSHDLTLHCHNTGANENLIRQYFKHPRLKLSFEPLKLHEVDTDMLQMHLNPLLPP